MSHIYRWMLSIFFLSLRTDAKQCVGTGPCSCEFDDGSGTVDLTSVGLEGDIRFKDRQVTGDINFYSYNPCFAFTTGTCSNVAACQITSDKTLFYNLGDQESATWSFDGTNVQVAYNGETNGEIRNSFVSVICDEGAEEPSLTVLGEQGTKMYNFELRSVCACPNACNGGGGGLSAGSVLIILFIVFVFVYIAGGVVYNRVRNERSGTDMLPNTGFWGAIPGLVKGNEHEECDPLCRRNTAKLFGFIL